MAKNVFTDEQSEDIFDTLENANDKLASVRELTEKYSTTNKTVILHVFGKDHEKHAKWFKGYEGGSTSLTKTQLLQSMFEIIGTGWNDVEYECLGENFNDRGIRSEEQIDLLRRLWKDEAITYEGKWHKITDAGLNPLPPNKNIPIWLGGMAPQVIDRVARLADGWFPFVTKELGSQIQQMIERAKVAERDPSTIGIECMVPLSTTVDKIKSLQDLGVTQVAIVTMNQSLESPEQHIDAIKRTRENLAAYF